MNEDEKLAMDESQRAERVESIKSAMRDQVEAEAARNAGRLDERERARAAALGAEMREKAIDEVFSTEREIERARTTARVSQVIDYVFYLIYGVIGLEIIFELIGARRDNAFRGFIDAVSAPLLAPFGNLVPDASAGRFQFRFSYVIALIVYALLHAAINGLLRLMAHRKTAV